MRLLLFFLATVNAIAASGILPTPHYFEPLNRTLAGPFQVVAAQADPKLKIAADMIGRELPAGAVTTIHLWDYSADARPPVKLNLLDREVLRSAEHWGQSYVVVSPDEHSVWIIGATAQGVLWGTASLLQLAEGGRLKAAYIRDYPDFEFRAASDWLLNIEVNGWAFDRGQGVDDFERVTKAKIDRAVRYKINMALMDGFGFSVAKRPAFYAPLMQRLNAYARARGVSLYFGGYGASYGMAYEPSVMYENGATFMGTVFENRKSYPNGEPYRCMGFPKARRGFDPALNGSCRSNEALNALKAAELTDFVRRVEPGALYIHHEDFGGFAKTEDVWRRRCAECRRRWPSDSLAAPDGGAGGLANGYAALIRGINKVKNPATGYDAARDCQIILVSPVYVPSGPTSKDWSDTLELWRNIGLQLPKSPNIQVCFREVWPLREGGERWTERVAATMKSAGLDLNTFLFYAGGADRFDTDYPLSGAPVMNALFLGARGMYNATGDFYQEPMELLAADYSWNARPGFDVVPSTYDEARSLLRQYEFEAGQPKQIFARGTLYDQICEHLYGKTAGPIMAAYYRLAVDLPEHPPTTYGYRPQTYLPLTWDRMYAAPSHWRHLVQDFHTWGPEIVDETYAAAVKRMGLSRSELHRRLARRWRLMIDLNRKGSEDVQAALDARPLASSVDDLRFLSSLLAAYQPLIQALAAYHEAMYRKFAPGEGTPDFQAAARFAAEAENEARMRFPQPIDPAGGEIGSLRKFSSRLVTAIAKMQEAR